MAIAYLLSLLLGVGVLAVALRRRPVPTPPAGPPALFAGAPGADQIEIVIRVAADQIAARLAPAA
ncbi:hypothetical protein ACIOJ9_39980 [Streptomyces sp. NPDC088175]|uniref:hypothetical protein n=1 Tax=unclassified Streptomyces TaxID=2593676 RepID=UPI0038228C6D